MLSEKEILLFIVLFLDCAKNSLSIFVIRTYDASKMMRNFFKTHPSEKPTLRSGDLFFLLFALFEIRPHKFTYKQRRAQKYRGHFQFFCIASVEKVMRIN